MIGMQRMFNYPWACLTSRGSLFRIQ